MKLIAIYPGSFDPITNGHIDILNRALKIFDNVIVLVADNPAKKPTFSVEERKAMIRESINGNPNVKVDSTTGLTIHYAEKVGAYALIRGLRAAIDFEYEFQINSANSFINSGVESVFLMAKQEFTFISSSTIKEMVSGGVDVSSLVPKPVLKRLEKLK
ncbi:MAG: pantetheine-phosphate adenylyltransferase [Bacilli bacterium]|jgi:pantetheine-phosphate adenylyltransferase|nr:pantetheine-phosphate adenylyltransferase [Bacillota bacterium]NLI52388.1 pantetheine-phosphate adenylyltransferase [Erysipelotrichaceae bacterium]OQC50157.1 MAG: Phosphopantetheine adenylyltransferase [Tenericutes bacterium ADurb.Bin024]HOE54303.1 pantetheine-phosphate adenylyltransferase [Bacilli bacterium]TAH58563.1 MAG: pantetheine-phosphate adenylyltransferase [Bacillota bacterium]